MINGNQKDSSILMLFIPGQEEFQVSRPLHLLNGELTSRKTKFIKKKEREKENSNQLIEAFSVKQYNSN